mgnify:CR=1 FL=1
MKINKNVNLIRGLAILIILYYHISAVTNVKFNIEIIDYLNNFLGEVGVTIFFFISGYGIYSSLKRKNGNIKYSDYMKKRFSRIAPQYYVCIIICLLFTSAGAYISKNGIYSIFSHVFFIHNFFISHHGAINGSLWSMGTILQFYLIAPFIYKAMEKKPWLTAIGSVLLTVCFKYLIMGVIIPETVEEGIRGAYFWVYGRQLITALDNFVIGMFIAKLLSEYDFESKIKKTNIIATILSFLALCFVILVGCNYYNVPYFFGGIYESSIKAYTYHSILVIFIGIFIYFMSKIRIADIIYKPINYISKYEYGIYLWHLPIINNLIERSEFIRSLIVNQNYFIYIIFMVIGTTFGIFMSEIIEKSNVFNKNKKSEN